MKTRISAITMMVLLVAFSFALAGQTTVIAQSDFASAMFAPAEDGATFVMGVYFYDLAQPCFNEIEQTDVTGYEVFQGHADIGTEAVIATSIMSVLKVSTYMLTSGSRAYNTDENTGEMTSEAIMRPKIFPGVRSG
jgi:hypothetical protein